MKSPRAGEWDSPCVGAGGMGRLPSALQEGGDRLLRRRLWHRCALCRWFISDGKGVCGAYRELWPWEEEGAGRRAAMGERVVEGAQW